jgi:hypothetical protein
MTICQLQNTMYGGSVCLGIRSNVNLIVIGNVFNNCTTDYISAGNSFVNFGPNSISSTVSRTGDFLSYSTSTNQGFIINKDGNVQVKNGARFTVGSSPLYTSWPYVLNVQSTAYGSMALGGGNGLMLFQGGGLGDNNNYIQSSNPDQTSNIPLNITGKNNTDGSLLNIKFGTTSITGYVGIGTTSPYAPLSVVGQIVGSYFTATTTSRNTFPYASTTAITSSYASSTLGYFGQLNIPNLSDGCLNITSGLVGSTGCGSGGISNPFTNSFMTVPSLGVQYTSATTSALKITSLATTTIANLNGVYVVPTDFATNGCAGNSSYTDFGQCLKGLYSLASTSGNYAYLYH